MIHVNAIAAIINDEVALPFSRATNCRTDRGEHINAVAFIGILDLVAEDGQAGRKVRPNAGVIVKSIVAIRIDTEVVVLDEVMGRIDRGAVILAIPRSRPRIRYCV